MSGSKVDIPTEFTIHLNPVHLEGAVGIAGVPGQPLVINAGLDDVHISLSGSRTEPVTVDLGLDKICISLAITEFPRMQVHVPTRYDLGFCLFSVPVFQLTLAGETMLITQDNPPRIVYSGVQPSHGRHPADWSTAAPPGEASVNIESEGLRGPDVKINLAG